MRNKKLLFGFTSRLCSALLLVGFCHSVTAQTAERFIFTDARQPPVAEGFVGEDAKTRLLAVTPPAPLMAEEKAHLRRALPKAGAKLLRGEAVTLLALGDSVTATGDYPQLLKMLLERATGNTRIRAEKKAYAGRSIDASVRHWSRDLAELQSRGAAPDIAFIMYGLNDQGAGTSPEAFQEGYRWLTQALRAAGSDVVFLQPTPHIESPPGDPAYVMRVLNFAALLQPLADELKVPLAPTFRALWGGGGATLDASIEAMKPLFPPHYSRQFESMTETEGKGDTIHPNALGHLRIARSILETLTGRSSTVAPLRLTGRSHWTLRGLETRLVVDNASPTRRVGRLEIFAPPDARIEAPPLDYDLPPGTKRELLVRWPDLKRPQDALKYPYNREIAPAKAGRAPRLRVVDFSEAKSRVYAVAAPLAVRAGWQRGRWNEVRGTFQLRLLIGQAPPELLFLPEGNNLLRIPLIHEMRSKTQSGYAIAEATLARYGYALRGEAQVDGDLAEWNEPVSFEVNQARWTRGPQDNRANANEAVSQWRMRAGEKGIYFAARVRGSRVFDSNSEPGKDNFTVYFDPRDKNSLGTMGPYFWLSGAYSANGQLKLTPGETSDRTLKIEGRWKRVQSGRDSEFFVPYSLMEVKQWPREGDMGMSLVWNHTGADDKITHLSWSEDGHPWTPRWWGIVRLLSTPQERSQLPYWLRIE